MSTMQEKTIMRFLGRLGIGYGLRGAPLELNAHCLVLQGGGSQERFVVESAQCSHQNLKNLGQQQKLDGSMVQQKRRYGGRSELRY